MNAIRNDRRRRRGVFLLATLLAGALSFVSEPATAQDATGRLSGLVLDPSGKPAEDMRLVFRDEAGLEHLTEPSDELGRYSIDVPAGSSYQLVAALTEDGERFEVPLLPPIPVDTGGRRLDIRIGYPAPAVAAAGASSGASGTIPWMQIGLAAGATLAVVIGVFGRENDEKTGSPFVPRDGS